MKKITGIWTRRSNVTKMLFGFFLFYFVCKTLSNR